MADAVVAADRVAALVATELLRATADALDATITGAFATVGAHRDVLRAYYYRLDEEAGAFELAHREDVPPRVAITEYVAVCDAFFGPKETGLVNGILDQLARQLRPGDMEPGGSQRG